jgi:iron complex transport system permease protein
VWRVQLGIEIPAAELVGRPLVDWDNDGVLSEEERANFVATAKHLGFAQRLPRTLLAIQVGITLALCGATFQVLFRNPLATPYTLGIAGGGSLGALIAIKVGWEVAWLGFSSTTLCALAGGLLVVGCVYLLARGRARLTSNEMLLAGVTMGLFCSAMMMVVTVIANERETFRMIRWMMGSLDTISSVKNVMLLPLVLPAWVVLIGQSRALNQYRLGDELAASRGVRVVALQTVAVLVGTLATAAVVAVCGPIGFVGLVVPHMAVLLFGADCRLRLPAAALLGGAFLVLCDWGAQLAMRGVAWVGGRDVGSATLPIGVITAVVGVPVFLILLATRGRRLSGR